jgi:hypothetical protein
MSNTLRVFRKLESAGKQPAKPATMGTAMLGTPPARIVGIALLLGAAMLTACPDPVAPEDGSSSTSSSGGSSTAGPVSSDGADTTTLGPDPGTSSTSTSTDTGTDEATESTGSGIDDPGCPACMVLAVDLDDGRGITVDLDHVYFTDQGRGTVERVRKGGGDGGVLVDAQDAPYGIAVSGEHVYWANFVGDGAVMRAPVVGGAATVVSDDAYPRTVAVVGDQIYWGTFEADAGSVMRIPVALDEAPTELAWVFGGVADLVVDGDRVFFTAHTNSGGGGFIEPPPKGPPIGSVFATPPGGVPDPFNAEQLAFSQAEPWGITLQGTTLLWANGMGEVADDARSVLAMPTAGGAIQALAAGQSSPWDVAADDQYVYWTDFTEVKAVPLAGGEEIVLAEQQNNARSIVVDDQWVFWITRDRVLQRPKP